MLIRLLWRKVVLSGYDATQIMAITDILDKRSFLCTVFGKPSFTDLPARWQNFAPVADKSSTYYWDLFVRYDWFYDYYRHHDKEGNRI